MKLWRLIFLLSSPFWVLIKLSFKLSLLLREPEMSVSPLPGTAAVLRQLFLPAAASFKDRPKNHRAHDKSFASDCIMYQQELWFQATVTVTVTRGYRQKVPAFTSLERDIIVMRK